MALRGEYERDDARPRRIDRRALEFPDEKADPAGTLTARQKRLAARAIELRAKASLVRTSTQRERYIENDRRGREIIRGAGRADRGNRGPDGEPLRERATAAEARAKGPREPERFCREVLDRLLDIRR